MGHVEFIIRTHVRVAEYRSTRCGSIPSTRISMINKVATSIAEALADVKDGATVLIGGFGTAGIPGEPHHRQQQRRQRRHRPRRAAEGRPRAQDHLLVPAPGRLARVRRPVPRRRDRARTRAAGQPGRAHPRRRRGHRRLLHADRLRNRSWPKGKETREIDGRQYVLEYPIHADVALIKAERGDRWGNLVYRKTARNFGPIMATAATLHDRHGARDRPARRASTPRRS